MRNSLLNVAVAAALLSKPSGGSAEIVHRDSENFFSPIPMRESKSRTIVSPYLASELKKREAKQKRKKIASASRKRNRK